jgi:hypothetical protein
MTQHGPCECSCDHEEEKDGHACCGGHHHDGEEAAGDDCGCGHDHGHSHALSAEDMEKLKSAIEDAGYKFEETPEGDIKIIEK